MNNCHKALVWPVSNRLKPTNKLINKTTILGPYLSRAQPPKRENIELSTMRAENIPEVAARVKLNSLSMDLKNTPKELYEP